LCTGDLGAAHQLALPPCPAIPGPGARLVLQRVLKGRPGPAVHAAPAAVGAAAAARCRAHDARLQLLKHLGLQGVWVWGRGESSAAALALAWG
jgi:hypothetical protein